MHVGDPVATSVTPTGVALRMSRSVERAPATEEENGMSLYDQLGGAPAISVALDRFYEKVLADPVVSVYFDRVDVDRVKERQRAFLAMAFGGPDDYQGRDLRTAHAAPRARGLDEPGYEVFMGYFRDTLAELGVAEPQIDEAMAIADTGKDDVLGR